MARSPGKSFARKLVDYNLVEMLEWAQSLRTQRAKALLARKLVREQRAEVMLDPVLTLEDLDRACVSGELPELTLEQKQVLVRLLEKANQPNPKKGKRFPNPQFPPKGERWPK